MTPQATAVRPPRPMVPPALRWTLGRLGRVAPGVAARIARRLFFTPIHAKVRQAEERALEKGERHEMRSRDRRIIYWTWGHGPAVVLTHGWGGHAGQMTAFVEPLLEAGFRVIAVDQPAHGSSSGRLSSLVHFAETLQDLAAEIGPFHSVVAHSLGTSATTLAVVRGLGLKRAVFLAPSASFHGIWRRVREGLDLSPRVWHRLVERTGRWLGIAFDDIEPRLLARRVELPLLILHDPSDREIPFSEGQALAAAWSGARLLAVEAGGHSRMLNDPRCVAEAVGFLASELQDGPDVEAPGGRREELAVEA